MKKRSWADYMQDSINEGLRLHYADVQHLIHESNTMRDALCRISKVKPDFLDHSIDVGIIERIVNVAKKAIS